MSEANIIREPRPENNFYILDKRISEDERLSWAARGMLIFLLGKPDYWRVSIEALVNCTAAAGQRQSGRTAVYAVINELLTIGYLARRKHADGTLNYLLRERPRPPEPDSGNPDLGKPDLGNPNLGNQTLVSTDSKKELKTQAKTDGASRSPRAKRDGTSLMAFLETCKATGEKVIPEDDPILKYADTLKMDRDFIWYAWQEFKTDFADESKKQKDWRAHFRNAVRKNWMKLWFQADDGNWILTTRGKQVKQEHSGGF